LSYFGVRIVDMRLAEGGKYFVDFLPAFPADHGCRLWNPAQDRRQPGQLEG
jgi:hypothetical protein